jgi:hypothetical protein
MGLSFTTAAGPRQRSNSQVTVPRNSWPRFFTDRIENTVHFLLQQFPWERVCLRRRYSATATYTCLLRICCLAADVVSLFVSRSLPSNGSTRYNITYYRCYDDTVWLLQNWTASHWLPTTVFGHSGYSRQLELASLHLPGMLVFAELCVLSENELAQ